jgi:CubicO group peptidase (beta-lactamase class C family)
MTRPTADPIVAAKPRRMPLIPKHTPRSQPMSRAPVAAALAALLILAIPVRGHAASAAYPGATWEEVDPEQAGWSASRLRKARDHFKEIGSSALVIVHDGRIVAAWGNTRKRIKIHSMRKSLMSAIYGVAVRQGQVSLDWTMRQLGIDDKPPRLTASEKQATVRQLLQARSGVYHEAAAETANMKKLRPERGSHAPGTFWYYNNWDFNVLGTILRNKTAEDTFDAMERILARPIGMERFRAKDGEYAEVKASVHPAYHMKFSARDLARVGWLFLNRGFWRGQQIIPAAWVAESTKAWTTEARRGVGYGYMWWVSMDDRHFRANVGPGSFSARGNGGQRILVAPVHRIVVVNLNDRSENEKLKNSDIDKLMKLIFAAAPGSKSKTVEPDDDIPASDDREEPL